MFSSIRANIRLAMFHRMAPWLWVSLSLMLLVGLFQPHLLPVSIYKLSLISMAAWMAYWIDRVLFPYARPDSFMDQPWSLGAPLCEKVGPISPEQALAFAAAMLRRAIIIAACVIGVALGA